MIFPSTVNNHRLGLKGGGRISGKQLAVVSGFDVGACVGGSVSDTGTITYSVPLLTLLSR